MLKYSNLAVELAKITTGYFHDEADIVVVYDNNPETKYEWDYIENVFKGIDGSPYGSPSVSLESLWLKPFWNCQVSDVCEVDSDMWSLYRITITLDDSFLDWAKEHLKETFDKYLAPHFTKRVPLKELKDITNLSGDTELKVILQTIHTFLTNTANHSATITELAGKYITIKVSNEVKLITELKQVHIYNNDGQTYKEINIGEK